MRQFILFAFAFALILPVQAKDVKNTIDLSTESCLNTNDSTAGMLECFTRAEQEWDTELNRVYKALQSKLKPAGQDALKQAQRAWITQRDKEFELINAIHGQMDGTMWIAVMASKRNDVVKARAEALQAYIDLMVEGGR
ncbi:DUF1311 domain-containing protein [Thiothrix litoralis]|jgi:uncharacterized protein YecT (DUF1311 family)|uniref:DUF1311 domain-containing protein n=1 Tax=Thiothrix litoralis TaxID=2891210 RepID=A0ABX7WT94_9GAMM|nr:lysozyme inhibitor LprI family protein [Thiothrix litoralis]QTR46732.1 DUF1311 domain-containing protein [Thiothrix litoralis]